MLNQILGVLDHAGMMISIFGVFIIAGGFIFAFIQYWKDYRKINPKQSFKLFKTRLGHTLMLGLEILVMADVIETITVTPTIKSLASLAFLIVLRTIVSWSLSLDVEGHWPWQGKKT